MDAAADHIQHKHTSDGKKSRQAIVLSIAALAAFALLLSEVYRQLPGPIFGLLSLSAVWLGIASLFSP
jgi:predicted exporter